MIDSEKEKERERERGKRREREREERRMSKGIMIERKGKGGEREGKRRGEKSGEREEGNRRFKGPLDSIRGGYTAFTESY